VVEKLLFVAACVLMPIAWGVLVHWLFEAWQARANEKGDDDPLFPDYQI
jgi:hypothetical protein